MIWIIGISLYLLIALVVLFFVLQLSYDSTESTVEWIATAVVLALGWPVWFALVVGGVL